MVELSENPFNVKFYSLIVKISCIKELVHWHQVSQIYPWGRKMQKTSHSVVLSNWPIDPCLRKFLVSTLKGRNDNS